MKSLKKNALELTVLGCRGSIPVSGSDSTVFGGKTSCYMVRAGEETIFLDGGSGLISAPTQFDRAPSILLSHFHLDHVIGLAMYPRLLEKGSETILYCPTLTPKGAREILDGVFSPPIWPLSLTEYPGTITLRTMSRRFRIGEVTVETMAGYHPGGAVVMRLSCGGKSLVYATDCEPDLRGMEALVSFSKDVDLLLFDGQYTENEYGKRTGFGHATAAVGLRFLERSGAKQLLVIHHDPRRTDEELLALEKRIGRKNVRFAREGETICL